MKHLAILVSILVCQNCLAQVIDTTDIFEVDKNHRLILRHDVQTRIDRKISPIVKKRLQAYKEKHKEDLSDLTDLQRKTRLEFVEDTIRINEFLTEYSDSYSSATITMGMNWGESHRLSTYDKLLNKYYQKALSVLQPAMKNKLVTSQKRWLDYYTKEKDFIYDLNDFGNHNSSLYNWGYYFEMLEKRVLFLKDIYEETFHGTDTYKQ
jgi:uncharacterized protein YecT (DUF1311 family)